VGTTVLGTGTSITFLFARGCNDGDIDGSSVHLWCLLFMPLHFFELFFSPFTFLLLLLLVSLGCNVGFEVGSVFVIGTGITELLIFPFPFFLLPFLLLPCLFLTFLGCGVAREVGIVVVGNDAFCRALFASLSSIGREAGNSEVYDDGASKQLKFPPIFLPLFVLLLLLLFDALLLLDFPSSFFALEFSSLFDFWVMLSIPDETE